MRLKVIFISGIRNDFHQFESFVYYFYLNGIKTKKCQSQSFVFLKLAPCLFAKNSTVNNFNH